MLAFESLIVPAAEAVGMKIPPEDQLDAEGSDGESLWSKEEYPHFFVFCQLQLGRSMSSWDQHWENAKVIAKISEEELRTMTPEDFERAGVNLS